MVLANTTIALVAGRSGARANEPARLFRVDGRSLLEGNRPVLLRGVAVGDAVLRREGRPPSDYAELAQSWGARMVRLSVHPGIWRVERERAAVALDTNVREALAAGLRVIIDWHVIGWPDGEFERPDARWGQPADLYSADLDLAIAFWRHIAERYAAEPRVIFEIWNEPVILTPKGHQAAAGEDWAKLRPIWIKLTEEVRKYAGNLILATGGTWASDLTGIREALLPDANTAYAWHVYPQTGGGTQEGWARILDDLDQVRPVFVTEWGFSEKPGHFQGTADGYGRTFTEGFLTSRRMHWTAWCWVPDWQPSLIEADWHTPTEAGRLVTKLLQEA